MAGYWADRCVVVSGSTRGIGEATVRHFAALGARCVVHGTDVGRGSALADELAGLGAEAAFVAADLSDEAGCRRLVDAAYDAFGAVDVLVNNAGANRFHGVLEASPTDVDSCLALDLRAAWLTSRRVVQRAGHRGGSIVNVSSNHAFATLPGVFPYNVAKAGVQALTQSLAIELAGSGFRANTVVPGYVDTPINVAYFGTFEDPAGERRRVEALHPLGRIGRPDEVARAIAFLASDEEAGFITGTSLVVDGGRSALLQDPVAR